MKKQIRAVRKSMRMNQIELAQELGVSQAAVSNWETGKDIPVHDTLAQLAKLGGISLDELSGSVQSQQVPVVGTIGIGAVINRGNGNAIKSQGDDVARPLGLSGDLEAVRVLGDGMYPFRAGWLLFYRKDAHGVADECIDELCIIQLSDGSIHCKVVRCSTTPDLFNLESFNMAFSPMKNQKIQWASKVLDIRPR